MFPGSLPGAPRRMQFRKCVLRPCGAVCGQATLPNASLVSGSQLRARHGITLFEAVASVAIVGVTAAAALSAVGSQFRTTARAQRALTVEALATSRLDFLDLLDGQNALNAIPDSVAKGEFPPPLDEYTWTTDVAPVSDEPGLYSVVVRVLWEDGSYELKSRAYRRPPLTTGNR